MRSAMGHHDGGDSTAGAWQLPLPGWVRLTLWAGLVAVAAYVAGWAIAGSLRAGYEPSEQAISELFELGAPAASRALLVVTLLLSGAVFLALAPALHRTLPGEGRFGPVLVAVAGVGTLGVVAAPCTPGCPGAANSTLDLWHTITAGIGYSTLAAAPLAFGWRLRAAEPRLARWSAVIGAAAILLFVLHTLDIGLLAPGAQQRLFNTVADAWYVMIAAAILLRDARLRRSVAVEQRARP